MIIIFAFILLGLIAVLVMAVYWGRSNWNQSTSVLVERIKGTATHQQRFVDFAELRDLPIVVKKYFQLVLEEGAPIINHASISQVGGFRTKPDMPGWSEMQAKQVYSTSPRAFVWDATISIINGFMINVCDSYINGRAGIQVKLLSLIPLIHVNNEKELIEGALQRYLAEAVWLPTALLPSQGVTWRETASNKAKATISDSGIRVSVEFEFNGSGEISSVYTPARYREVAGKFLPTPWKGYFSNYIQVDDYSIPASAKVEWHLEHQVYPYWQAELHNISYVTD